MHPAGAADVLGSESQHGYSRVDLPADFCGVGVMSNRHDLLCLFGDRTHQ